MNVCEEAEQLVSKRLLQTTEIAIVACRRDNDRRQALKPAFVDLIWPSRLLRSALGFIVSWAHATLTI